MSNKLMISAKAFSYCGCLPSGGTLASADYVTILFRTEGGAPTRRVARTTYGNQEEGLKNKPIAAMILVCVICVKSMLAGGANLH
jgi:hypothetical protein